MSYAPQDEDGFGRDDVVRLTGVSRETIGRVEAFLDILDEWRERYNVIGPNEGRHIWRRHILDSMQLVPLMGEDVRSLADLGTGGGFPGVILACALADRDVAVTLVEKSVRKAQFLEDAVRRLGLNAMVSNQRIEDAPEGPVDVVTARALAPVARLLPMLDLWLKPSGRALLLKGRSADEEIVHARETRAFDVERRSSLSGPDGQVLILSNLSKRAEQSCG